MAQQILNIPIGYAASFTTDALTSGTYIQYDNIRTGYTPVSFNVSTSYVLGPYNEVANFLFTTAGDNRATFTLAISGVNTAADDAVVGTKATATSGTFTPVLRFGGLSVGITYATQVGYWSRVGDIMHVDLDIILTSKGSSTGVATIAGLPVVSRTGPSHQMFALGAEHLTFANNEVPKPRVASNSSVVLLYNTKSNAASTAAVNSDFANNTTIEISGTYLV